MPSFVIQLKPAFVGASKRLCCITITAFKLPSSRIWEGVLHTKHTLRHAPVLTLCRHYLDTHSVFDTLLTYSVFQCVLLCVYTRSVSSVSCTQCVRVCPHTECQHCVTLSVGGLYIVENTACVQAGEHCMAMCVLNPCGCLLHTYYRIYMVCPSGCSSDQPTHN